MDLNSNREKPVGSKNFSEIEARGLAGPLAVVKARETLRWLNPGEGIELVLDDEQVVKEMEIFCSRSGDEFHQTTEGVDVYRVRIVRTTRPPRPFSRPDDQKKPEGNAGNG